MTSFWERICPGKTLPPNSPSGRTCESGAVALFAVHPVDPRLILESVELPDSSGQKPILVVRSYTYMGGLLTAELIPGVVDRVGTGTFVSQIL